MTKEDYKKAQDKLANLSHILQFLRAGLTSKGFPAHKRLEPAMEMIDEFCFNKK